METLDLTLFSPRRPATAFAHEAEDCLVPHGSAADAKCYIRVV